MKWKSPRCSAACWDEIKASEADRALLLNRLLEITRDRDEWKEQHEKLLLIYHDTIRSANADVSQGKRITNETELSEVLKNAREEVCQTIHVSHLHEVLIGFDLAAEASIVFSKQ